MSKRLACPYLGGDVELAAARVQHIAERHPELLPQHLAALKQTVADPDEVRRSTRAPSALLFVRRFEDGPCGMYTVVVVVSETRPRRNWVVTAYLTRRPSIGHVEWSHP